MPIAVWGVTTRKLHIQRKRDESWTDNLPRHPISKHASAIRQKKKTQKQPSGTLVSCGGGGQGVECAPEVKRIGEKKKKAPGGLAVVHAVIRAPEPV